MFRFSEVSSIHRTPSPLRLVFDTAAVRSQTPSLNLPEGPAILALAAALCYTVRMQSPKDSLIHSEEFLHHLMRRQLRLSITCAAAFLVVLLGLPLTNYFLPELMAKRVFGFTLTWFVLGVLFFPFVWVIAWIFIKRSIELENEEVKFAESSAASSPSARDASRVRKSSSPTDQQR
jgi:uncharacterized membrane protein (DUF485 family)